MCEHASIIPLLGVMFKVVVLRRRRLLIQHAAKGGRQKGVGHSQFFGSLFGNPVPIFGHFLVIFFSFLVTFLPIPFCLPPFAAR